MKLNGKVAFITGANRGIGRGCAIELAREGADIAINYYRHAGEAEAVAEQVRSLGRRALVLQGDVADRPHGRRNGRSNGRPARQRRHPRRKRCTNRA